MTILHQTNSERFQRPLSVALAPWLLGAAMLSFGCASDDTVTASAHSPATTLGGSTRVLFADNGKLSDGMAGYAWVAAGSAAVVETPNPCNDMGCFRNVQGALCTRGRMPALTCQSMESWDCNYDENWGVMVGFNPNAGRGPWGPTAPQTVAITYTGGAGNYRLSAHVAGDPDKQVYCIEGYVSGVPVEAGRLKTKCWSSDGVSLPSFAVIDHLALVLTATKSPISFDYCVSEVTLNLPADPLVVP